MACKIKICGITRVEDAQAVAAAGADALGLMFAPQSARRVSLDQAQSIAAAVAGQVVRVGVFFDPEEAVVRAALQSVDLDMLQFHGAEPAEFCASFGLPYMKAFRVAGPFDANRARADYPDACCLLLDAYVPDQPGGTGTRFDTNYWPRSAPVPLVLSGGLAPGNVARAVAELQPFGVDLSSGVETAVKGHKDAKKIQAFVSEVKRARC